MTEVAIKKGTVTYLFIEELEKLRIPWLNMILFCSEGVNTHEAQNMGNVVLEYLEITHISQFRFPKSWSYNSETRSTQINSLF